MRTVARSTLPPGRMEPASETRPASTEPARTQPVLTGPTRAPVNYLEKAREEMKWMEEIQVELKRVEDLQQTLAATNVKDELAPVAEELRRRFEVRKENFQKYRSLTDKDESSEK